MIMVAFERISAEVMAENFRGQERLAAWRVADRA
jgi:hypothetical protein